MKRPNEISVKTKMIKNPVVAEMEAWESPTLSFKTVRRDLPPFMCSQWLKWENQSKLLPEKERIETVPDQK